MPGANETDVGPDRMHLLESEGDLKAALDGLAGQPLLAMDTEAAGYHRYRDRVCLVQISTRTDTWVVDALAVDIALLDRVLSDERTEVVLHDADYDLRLLARDHGLRVARLFDTKVAAQLLGQRAIGLAGLTEQFLGVQLDKTHQRADWARRPLTRQQLEYAADDTRYLPALRDRLAEELITAGRMDWALEEFALRVSAPPANAEPRAEAFWKLRNTRDLRGKQLAVLRAVHGWRDAKARTRDVAPFRVLSNDAVVGIARDCPVSRKALASVAGMPASLVDRHAGELLGVVRRALRSDPETWPVRKRRPRPPPPDAALDERIERLKGVRDRMADDLGLERGFLMPRAQLEDIARKRPDSVVALKELADVRNWQVDVLGGQILRALG